MNDNLKKEKEPEEESLFELAKKALRIQYVIPRWEKSFINCDGCEFTDDCLMQCTYES